MKIIFILLLSILPTVLISQELKEIDSNVIIKEYFEKLSQEYRFKYILVEDVFTQDLRTISISKDSICINDDCYRITSPIYYLQGVKKPEEMNFSFRFAGGRLCILFFIKEDLETID